MNTLKTYDVPNVARMIHQLLDSLRRTYPTTSRWIPPPPVRAWLVWWVGGGWWEIKWRGGGGGGGGNGEYAKSTAIKGKGKALAYCL